MFSSSLPEGRRLPEPIILQEINEDIVAVFCGLLEPDLCVTLLLPHTSAAFAVIKGCDSLQLTWSGFNVLRQAELIRARRLPRMQSL